MRTVTREQGPILRPANLVAVRIHFYSQGSKIVLYEHPRPEPAPGDYHGEVDLNPEELEELHRMVEETIRP